MKEAVHHTCDARCKHALIIDCDVAFADFFSMRAKGQTPIKGGVFLLHVSDSI